VINWTVTWALTTLATALATALVEETREAVKRRREAKGAKLSGLPN